MLKKKIVIAILLTGSILGTSAKMLYSTNGTLIAKAENKDITLLAYKPAAQVNTSGYQIDKFDNLENVAWLKNDEVLSLKFKELHTNPDSTVSIRYCSIYNLSTKTTKDFKDVNIDYFLGVSPDKKYVMYSEAINIPKGGSEEWQKAYDSGELLHRNIKILNLTNGEITDLKTEKINSDAEFIWISNNKILSNYFQDWKIIDISGKVYAEGSYNNGKYNDAWISGTDIKDLGDSVEGKIYYSQWENGKEGTKVLSMDVKSKEIKSIFYNQYSLHAEKQGNTLLIDNYTNNGEKSPGVYNRTFGAYVIGENGEIKKDIKLLEGCSKFILSPDGSKAAYASYIDAIDKNASLNVIDINTGEVKEIIKASKISNICWDSTGTTLSFTSGNSMFVNKDGKLACDNVVTYVIGFNN